MKIQVILDDILNGKRHSGENCPIAIAVKRASKCKNVDVGYGGIWVGLNYFQFNSSAVLDFVYNFDFNYGVSPLEFELPDSLFEQRYDAKECS